LVGDISRTDWIVRGKAEEAVECGLHPAPLNKRAKQAAKMMSGRIVIGAAQQIVDGLVFSLSCFTKRIESLPGIVVQREIAPFMTRVHLILLSWHSVPKEPATTARHFKMSQRD
jgi:hypothetical protein